jgi:hypothetical protein
MAGSDFFIAQGDTASPLTDTLLDSNGNPVDLQGATVELQLFPLEGSTSSVVSGDDANAQTGDGSDGSLGDVSYQWQIGETDDAGVFLGYWVVTFGGGDIQTFPNDGPFSVQITPDGVPTVTAFASSEDLADRLGVEFTAAEHRRAKRLLALATKLIQSETGQTVFLVEDDVFTTRGTVSNRIALPQRPVVAIDSVTVDGTALDAAGYYVSGSELVRQGWGGSGFGSPLFGYPTQELVVTYSHGFDPDEIPGDVSVVCLEMVARVWVNPGAVVSQTIGGLATTYSVQPVNGMLLTDAERDQIQRALGAGAVGTVQLR